MAAGVAGVVAAVDAVVVTDLRALSLERLQAEYAVVAPVVQRLDGYAGAVLAELSRRGGGQVPTEGGRKRTLAGWAAEASGSSPSAAGRTVVVASALQRALPLPGPAGRGPRQQRRRCGRRPCAGDRARRPGLRHRRVERPADRARIETLLCDARISRVLLDRLGQVRGLESVTKDITPAQRRALAARDVRCVARGCTRPPAMCDAHHLTARSDGGATTLDNLVLLCRRHHVLWHLGKLILHDLHVPWLHEHHGTDPPKAQPAARRGADSYDRFR